MMKEKQILTAEVVDGGVKIDVENMDINRILSIAISLIVHSAAAREMDGEGLASDVWQTLNDNMMDKERWTELVFAAMQDMDAMEGKQDGK